jgi:cytochrome c5
MEVLRFVQLVVATAGVACTLYPKSAAAPTAITEADVQIASSKWPDANADSLEAGRKVFVGTCNHCHEYPDVHAVEENAWPPIVKRMGKKAGLTETQIEEATRFILVARERPP